MDAAPKDEPDRCSQPEVLKVLQAPPQQQPDVFAATRGTSCQPINVSMGLTMQGRDMMTCCTMGDPTVGDRYAAEGSHNPAGK
jgi:hypothetical protein